MSDADPSKQLTPGFEGIPDTSVISRLLQRSAFEGDPSVAFAAAPPSNLILYFNPETAPFRGMNSSLVPSALKIGQWPLIQDMRPDDNSLMCRYPTVSRNPTGL